MNCIEDLRQKFHEYKNVMETCLPQVDKKLITEILYLMEKEKAPVYTLEIFLKENSKTGKIREIVTRHTEENVAFYEGGTHVVAAHKITLQLLRELCENNDVE